MFTTRWRLFRLLGIPIAVDASWLIILALLTLSLNTAFPHLLESYYPDAPRPEPWVNWVVALLTALAFFGCIVLHELGHAVVARAQQMRIRGITLFLFGGVAEIGDEPPSARAELLTALGGPAVSVVLAALFGVLAWLGYQQQWAPLAVIALTHLAVINVVVLAFNLIPAFPLDGGRVLRSILWGTTGSLRRATYWASGVGRFFAFLLILWGVLNFFAGNWLGGVWIGLIGLFLNNAALAGYQQVLIRQALQGEPVERLMTADPITVPPWLSLRQWVEDFVYRYQRKAFPVVSEGRLHGLIETRALAEVPREEWESHPVEEVMRHDLAGLTISPRADALEAMTQMQRNDTSRLLVTNGGQLVGILCMKDLLRFLSLKLELEGEDRDEPGAAALPTRSPMADEAARDRYVGQP